MLTAYSNKISESESDIKTLHHTIDVLSDSMSVISYNNKQNQVDLIKDKIQKAKNAGLGGTLIRYAVIMLPKPAVQGFVKKIT